MKNSNINMNKPPLSEDEIQKAKDFDKVLNDLNPKSGGISKVKRIAIVGGAIALVIAGGIWIATKNNSTDTTSQSANVIADSVNISQVNPPIANVDVPKTDYHVVAEMGHEITTPTGTQVRIPKNAFMDENGKLVMGDVQVLFREFHDVPSIFAAGINMRYDSAGTEYHFESAGMFEIKAFQNGKQLYTNPDAIIEVDLASSQGGDYFNIYYLDEEKGWKFVEKDTAKRSDMINFDTNTLEVSTKDMIPLAQAKKEYAKTKKSYEKAVKKAGLVIPKIANDDLYSMKLSFKKSEFPALKVYKNVLFEITESNKDFDPALAKESWNDIELKKNLKGAYVMHLYGDKKKEKLIVRPVFAKEDLTKAEVDFEKLFVEYDAKLNGKLKEKKMTMLEKYKTYKAIEQNVYSEINQKLYINEMQGQINDQTNKVKRVFQVENFGMWNSDCPSNLPKGQLVSPVFVDASNEKDTLKFHTLYIAEYGNNALYTLYGDWGNKEFINDEGKKENVFDAPEFSFNPKKSTVLWCVTAKGDLAAIVPESLNKITFGEDYTTLKMKLYPAVGDVSSIKKIIGWQ